MTTQLNPDLLTTIAQKLANQIIAFQQFIEARPVGQQFPTIQEANQQHKLITCLLRLVKQPARPRKEKVQDPSDIAALNSWAKTVNDIFSMPTESDLPAKEVAPKFNTPAITQRDFDQYGHLLGKSSFANLTDKTTIKFNGRYVNAKWLEYNLFQYCLPADNRHFIDDARKVIGEVDHKITQESIAAYLAGKTMQKLAA
ncbi:hypothetical protein CJD36_006100 [Flavipsychrobacter stenotrophus]|uniref:Uncharacterized protein n=1 Tax=Flavipsychrobacter stenotrophus TaxID=2077091 RepID=A0A2S7SWR3_9BACT|nr:hypothetical protein [Flavipsychrobacter stenotrophus]PQJ11370.1 hypothetical protein CJD36_006100 [Flavipsychrobacter stenotrophus]